MTIRIIPLSADGEPMLSPDIVFDGIMGDFALAADGEAQNRAGLSARKPLETAVIIALMTDCRADPYELRDGDENKGWHGDGYDVDAASGERDLGSKLWLLRRSAITDPADIERRATDYARAALQTLIDQGAAAAIDISAKADPLRHRLDLSVILTDKAGAVAVDRRFAVLWGIRNGA